MSVSIDGSLASEVTLSQTVQQVKHGLGDLKAEWLLMRRDIQEVRLDAGSLRASQSAIKDDTARLKAVIDLVKTESGRLKAQLDQLTSLVNKLQSNVRHHHRHQFIIILISETHNMYIEI